MSEKVPYWKQQELKAKKKKNKEEELKKSITAYEDIGKVVSYRGEKGILVLGQMCGQPEVVIRWDTSKKEDYEGYLGFAGLKFIEEPIELKHINRDGTLKNNL